MTIRMGPGGTSITGVHLDLYRMLVQRSGLALEVKGFKHSRGSVYAQVKREYGLKGNKAKVLQQLEALIEQWKVEHPNPHTEDGK